MIGDRRKNACNIAVIAIIVSILEVCGYITLIILYSIILKGMNKIDRAMLSYAVENKCSDAVLQYAITKFHDSFTHDYSVLVTGQFFTVASLIALIIAAICASDLRDILADKFKSEFLKKPPPFEAQAVQMRDQFRSRISNLMARAFKKKLGDKLKE